MKTAVPPALSSARCSHDFPTKPCGHMVSLTKVMSTGMGSTAAARVAAIPDERAFGVRQAERTAARAAVDSIHKLNKVGTSGNE